MLALFQSYLGSHCFTEFTWICSNNEFSSDGVSNAEIVQSRSVILIIREIRQCQCESIAECDEMGLVVLINNYKKKSIKLDYLDD